VKNSNSTDKEIRIFGVVALLFFGALCGLGIWRDKTFPMVFFGALSFLGLLFLLAPGPMRPVHAGWLRIAGAIGRAVNAVMLTVAFFCVMLPAGWVMRRVSGAFIPMKPDTSAPSYWVAREEPAQPKERFVKRF
jgi:hypothetical protein